MNSAKKRKFEQNIGEKNNSENTFKCNLTYELEESLHFHLEIGKIKIINVRLKQTLKIRWSLFSP